MAEGSKADLSRFSDFLIPLSFFEANKVKGVLWVREDGKVGVKPGEAIVALIPPEAYDERLGLVIRG